MERMRNYDVQFSGLKEGEHHFSFEVSQSFFDLFTFEQDFENPSIEVEVFLNKKTTFMELVLQAKGTVEVNCDITNEPYKQKIEDDLKIVVKFGDSFDDSDDEVLVIPHGSHSVNVARLIFELTLLSIPLKRVNPNIDSEEMQRALDLLEDYAPYEEEEEEDVDDENDPRWDKLKDLL